MASIALSVVPLTTLKKLARTALPEVKSAHLSEALASAVGYGTHAALRADLPAQAADPAIVLLDEQRFAGRLTELGYPAPSAFSFEAFTEPRFSVDRTTGRRKRIDYERQLAHVDGVISTTSFSNGPHAYKSARGKAWRNLMVAVINEGLRRKLFSLRYDDNRWRPGDPMPGMAHGDTFEFLGPAGLLLRVAVADVSFGELRFDVNSLPAGVSATAFLERARGAWLQNGESSFRSTRPLTARLASEEVAPLGYGDRGWAPV